jgi:hypothetical protein
MPYIDQYEQQVAPMMSQSKGRNQLRVHQQTAQVQMKNALIGLTDNPSSSNGDSSVLTIGLPSVMDTQSMINLGEHHSHINVNMNVNFNINSESTQLRRNIPQRLKKPNQTTAQQGIPTRIIFGQQIFSVHSNLVAQQKSLSRNRIGMDSAEALRQKIIGSRQNSQENDPNIRKHNQY